MVGGIPFYRLCPLRLLVVGFMFHLWQSAQLEALFWTLICISHIFELGTCNCIMEQFPRSLSFSHSFAHSHLSLQLEVLLLFSLSLFLFLRSVCQLHPPPHCLFSVVTCFCCLVVPADDRFTCVVSGSECSGSGLTLHSNDGRQHLALAVCRVSNNR